MSDAGRTSRPGAPSRPAAAGAEADPFVPGEPTGVSPAQRFARVGEQRAAAAAQIQRTLRVWRKASDGAAKDEGDEAKAGDQNEEKEKDEESKDQAKGEDKAKGEEKDQEAEEKGGEEPAPISAKLDGVGRKIFRANQPQPGGPPMPPPTFDVNAIANGANIRVGNLLATPGPGHAVLQGLAAGDPNALAPVGVGALPAGFPTNGVEWGLGQLQDGRCFVIRGGAGAVNWTPFPNVTPLAHSHPLRPIVSQGGKTMQQVFNERETGEKVLPSNSDLKVMADQGVPRHMLHTPFRFEPPDKVDNPSGPTDRRPVVSFAIVGARRRPVGFHGNANVPVYQCTLNAEQNGQQFWSSPIESCLHPHLGDYLAMGLLP